MRPESTSRAGSHASTITAIGHWRFRAVSRMSIARHVTAHFATLSATTPVLADVKPSGPYLLEDFGAAGGVTTVMRELAGVLDLDACNAHDTPWRTALDAAAGALGGSIRSATDPVAPEGGIAVLTGNLAPRGAVLKPSAATPALMVHRGRAVVFDSIEHFKARVDDPALDIDETCVMVLKNCGPRGYPGIAEVGNMPLPEKILKKGITDMVRISDARMSGTAYGTVVLHAAPEAAAGGPLAIVRDGDMIELDVPKRSLKLLVDDGEIERRLKDWKAPALPSGGYKKLYVSHVNQADQGCDLDFLVGCRGAEVPPESH